MKASKMINRSAADARKLEQEGRLEEAAAVYQRLVNADATDREAVERLLVIYRRLKNYKKELAVIGSALAAYAQRDKSIQQKWISEHPQAAKAGRAFLKTMGGASVSAFGTDPMAGRLQKRKAFVEKRLHGGKVAAKKRPAVKSKGKGDSAAGQKAEAAGKRKGAVAARREAAAAKREAAGAKREAVAKAKREAAAAAKKAAADKKAAEREAAKKAAADKKAAAKAAAEEARAHPPMFVISLRYLVSPERIGAAMPKHQAFLNKHLAAGNFLISGQEVPPTGEIIIARGKDRAFVERIMKQDPLHKSKLVSIDIVEFRSSSSKPGK